MKVKKILKGSTSDNHTSKGHEVEEATNDFDFCLRELYLMVTVCTFRYLCPLLLALL